MMCKYFLLLTTVVALAGCAGLPKAPKKVNMPVVKGCIKESALPAKLKTLPISSITAGTPAPIVLKKADETIAIQEGQIKQLWLLIEPCVQFQPLTKP